MERKPVSGPKKPAPKKKQSQGMVKERPRQVGDKKTLVTTGTDGGGGNYHGENPLKNILP